MPLPWFRLWTDMPYDPKWRTIARESKQHITLVICVYLHLMTAASNASERGRTQGTKSEDIASALDVETSAVDAVMQAMQGRVLDGNRLTGWDKRQPNREDGSAERAKAWRDAKKVEKESTKTGPNADQTQANAEERPEEIKKETQKKGGEHAPDGAPPPPMPDQYRQYIATARPDIKRPDLVFQNFWDAGKRTVPQWRTWVRKEHAGKEQPSTEMDPDSLGAVKAQAAAKGLGDWNQLRESFDAYKARVRAAPCPGGVQ